MQKALLLLPALLLPSYNAAAQMPEPVSVTPLVTIRVHGGPNLNLMGEWRDGMSSMQSMAEARGLSIEDESGFCVSWGTTALVHVTPRIAIGASFDWLRDMRHFSVSDFIPLLDQNASFGFGANTLDTTKQAVVAFYPRETSRMHVQVGAGVGSGRVELSTPGSDALGRAKGLLFSGSAGMETRFWYVDAGWRIHRLAVTYDAVSDHAIDFARDIFADEAEVRDFVRNRDSNLSGGWMRVGLAFHFGRR